jgi:cell division protein FtsW (lipid II flippase)
VISPRTRELGFMLPAVAVGLLGIGTVATVRADEFAPGPWPQALGVIGVFLVMHVALRVRAPQADPYVLPIVGVLVAIGLVQLNRINPELAANQALWVSLGGLVFVAVLLFLPDHRVLERYRYIIGASAVAVLLITMVFGTEINGARLWITAGPITLQLNEVAKILLVIFLAGYLRDKREILAIPTRRVAGVPVPPLSALGPVLVVLAACLGLVVVLNDFGTALLFFGIFLAMLYLATGRVAYTVFGLGLFLIGSVMVYFAAPHVASRVDHWLHPFRDEQGQGFQLVQSMYALAEGGVLGPGLGQGFLLRDDGSYTVPVLPTDFIFTAIATELGFVGGVAVLLCFLIFLQRGFSIAAGATDGFSKLLAGGLTVAVGLQALVIVGGVVRLMPLTGVTLPFISYGGSSVLTNFAIVALLLIISHRSRVGPRPVRRRRADRARDEEAVPA